VIIYGKGSLLRLESCIAESSDIPLIPNFELLGRIGGGSYGEVYLARSVTGMYRAVKVVRREDFEFERTFEREFEGIQKYEKVSQDHPWLVDVLHVGRSREEGFYYYVMELADDEGGGHEEVDVDSYRPRTLSSDLRRKSAHSVRECVDLGMSMAGALGHLHHAGLTHRDVKPSNIIYVKGQPKLADVGLVAATGQRTFVGTEGYVPPEGPGTSSADLYSLAMVLYEMHTGKCRLDFPELPTNLEIPPTVNRDEWRALNGVICRAGSPDPRKRFESAHSLARALQSVCGDLDPATSGRRKRSPFLLIGAFATLLLLAAAGFGFYWLWQDNQSFVGKHGTELAESGSNGAVSSDPGRGVKTAGQVLRPAIDPLALVEPVGGVILEPVKGMAGDPGSKGKERVFSFVEPSGDMSAAAGEVVIRDEVVEVKTKGEEGDGLKTTMIGSDREKPALIADPLEQPIARVKIMSRPSGATVTYQGREIGMTETRLLEFPIGPIELTLRREGFHEVLYRGEIVEGKTSVIEVEMLPDRSPVAGSPWVNSLGLEFTPAVDGTFVSLSEIELDIFDLFLSETGLQIPRGGVNGIAQVPEDSAIWKFCDWMTEKDRAAGYLGPKRYYYPRRQPGETRRNSFFCSIESDFGMLLLNSEPSGARVFDGDTDLGKTPIVLNEIRFGIFELQLYLPGYRVTSARGDINETLVNKTLDLVQPLERDASVVFGQPWANSQGMGLVPFENLLVASTETPSRAYLEFLTDEGVVTEPVLAAPPGSDYPAYGVGYAEAVGFCEWLTRRERALHLIRPWQRYRLPTDLEWSRFAGLRGESGATPEQRNSTSGTAFPWGPEWPPPAGAGNFADISATAYFGTNIVEGYTDGFDTTAPVGSFTASPSGFYDLAGNVWEWVLDPYTDGNDGLQVVRGGGWNSAEREVLATAYRNPVPASSREGYYGFRYVLENVGATE
jgi:eukaryotic-like serine/threonine-protein kinase